ncbi:hypothetical protein PARPLA_00163 [Rhodobacteraceae bacterium THAF1]|uniref:FliH/SctL family protein n=1 Tax=Palleronia sp. THAF1 TaxID=2587842 RepID=UPI000F3F2D7B|nr:hypothetical protein [Palleronia sp. THAF1]QFU10272.1 hypothetical protein FIU81_16445 [Palleronia sp. THAF1]VDC16823.1 hypothetical protein PARPLA_00163 [Rhodobacteraceae bacterium THAF1]
MSASPLILEDFGQYTGLVPLAVIDGERLEAEKLATFDKGYTAGWDDATDAYKAEADGAERALAARMEELGFTFHEARAHVMSALRPLLSGIVETIVPRVLQETLGHRLEQAMHQLADGQPDPEVLINVCPDDAEQMANCLSAHARFPTRIEADDSLGPGLIHIRLGQSAREIDLSIVEATLNDALAALDTLNEETLSHG